MEARTTDRYFTVDGARLRFRDEGSGPALLLLHGWTLDLEMWNTLAAALCDEFRIVRFDRRGFGISSGRPSIGSDITDLHALWRHLKLENVALLGMSQGARAVVEFAAQTDRKICCLVLDGPPDFERDVISGVDPGDGDHHVPLAHYSELVRTKGVEAFQREWTRHPLMQLRSEEPNARQLLNAIIRRYPGNDLLLSATEVAWSGTPHLVVRPETIAMPTLVITGEHDFERRVKAADILARRLPRAERAIVAGAGHLPNLDNPVRYNNLVRTFLKRHVTAGY